MLACLCWPWGSGGRVGASILILQTLTDQTTLDSSNPAGERQSNHFMANPFTIPLRSGARNARDPRAHVFSGGVCAKPHDEEVPGNTASDTGWSQLSLMPSLQRFLNANCRY